MPCSGNRDRALPPGLSKEGREKGCVGVSGKEEFMGERVFLVVGGGVQRQENILL